MSPETIIPLVGLWVVGCAVFGAGYVLGSVMTHRRYELEEEETGAA